MTGFICHVGFEVTREVLRHLMDGVELEVVTASGRAATTVPGVEPAHVRARWMGRSLLVEVEGFMAPGTTVAAGEATGRAVEAAVAAAVPEARAVMWSSRAMTS